jgi:hypothetical protein
MADQDQISGKVQIDISEAQQALSQIAAILQQTQQTMQDGFKQVQGQSTQSTQQIKQDFDKMGTGVAGAIKDMHGQVTSGITAITSTLTKLGEIAMGIGAIMAGGAMFKGVVDKYVEMNLEAKKLSTVMGMNVSDAQALIQSFGRVGVSGDTLAGSLTRMTRQLKTNEQGFNDNGIKTRDANGSLISMNEILFNSIDAMKGMEAGTERNMLATTIFGRSVEAMPGFLRMTSAAVDEMRDHLASLGLTVTDVSVAKSREFKEGMHDVDLVFDSIKYKIGEAVIPALISLGKAFSAVGPEIAKFTADAINFFASMVRGAQDFMMQATVVASNIRDAFQGTWEAMSAGAAAVKQRLMETCGTDVVGAFAAGMAAMKSSLQDWREQAIRDSNDVRFALMNAQPAIKGKGGSGDPVLDAASAAGAKPKPGAETPSGGNKFVAKDTGGKGGGGAPGDLQVWKDELDQLKMAQNQFLDFSKQAEREFWAAKLEICAEGSKEYLAVRKEIFTIDKGLAKQEAQDQLAEMDRQMVSERTNWASKRALMTQETAFVKSTWGEQSNEYRAILKKQAQFDEEDDKHKRDLLSKQVDGKAQLAQMDLARQEQTVKFEEQMGEISATTALARLRVLKAKELEIERQAIAQKMVVYKNDEKQQEILGQQLATFKQKKLTEEQKALQTAALKNKETIQSIMAPIQSAIQGSIMGIIQGTTTMKAAIQNLCTSIIASFVGMATKMAETWIANQLEMLIYGKASQEEAAISSISASAGKAGAAGFASVMEDMPYPANIAMAPEVALAAAAGAMSFLGMASYDVGAWNIPRTGAAMLHKGEAVLPADKAAGLDRLMDNGSPGKQKQGDIHLHINALDGADVQRVLLRNPNALAAALKSLGRNFVPVT